MSLLRHLAVVEEPAAEPTRRQAIRTTYLPPTNHRGARIKAQCEAGKVIVSWDDRWEPSTNHARAVDVLCATLDKRIGGSGWREGEWIGGSIPDGSMVWVDVSNYVRIACERAVSRAEES